ncbi:MAG TPA: amphi-Trp domain-containing protein [Miltoncostaeales bacterium]|nr:amphi-Trp domain-containing protein [Miltoncostaeales bacterium]
MTRHVFDIKELAPHEKVATQLRALADQIAAGRVEMAYDDLAAPIKVNDPIELVLDLIQHKHDVELNIAMRWPTPA